MNNTNNALETLVQRDKQIKKANDKLKASINKLDAELETTTNALSTHASNTDIHTSKEELIQLIVDHLESLDLGITKEVVSVLPTENISDNTLYFVPNDKGSRDEYLYINDKWELVGSTETNFTDYYTKLETNTLLESKANSVHSHVVSDITDMPTIPTKTSQLINDSGFLTSSSGVITSVSWSDITNKPNFSTVATSGSYTDLSNTPAIPTKVSQLENDMGFGTGGDTSDCVHKTGNETINGIKTFTDKIVSNKELHYKDTKYDWTDTSLNVWCDAGHVVWLDKTGNRRMHELVGANGGIWRKSCYINENQYFSVDSNRNITYWGTTAFNGHTIFTQDIFLKDNDIDLTATPTRNTYATFTFTDKNNNIIGFLQYCKQTSGNSYIGLNVRDKNSNTWGIQLNTNKEFVPLGNNSYSLGSANYKWAKVYSDDVVHRSGNETIGGAKTFTDNIKIQNSDIDLMITPTSNKYSKFPFTDKNNKLLGIVQYAQRATDVKDLDLYVYDKNSTAHGIQINTNNELTPIGNNYSLGSSSAKWANVYATTFNGNLVGGITLNQATLKMTVKDSNSETTRTNDVILANSANTAYGINVAFGGSGNTVVGAGESYTAQLNELAGSSQENLYLTADNNIYFKPGADTFANAKTVTLSSSAELSGLSKVTATSFVGALTGNVTGNATSATKASYLDNYSLPGGNKIYLDWDVQKKGYVGLKVDKTNMGGLITTSNIGSYVNSVASFRAVGPSAVGSSISAYYSNATTLIAEGSSSSSGGSYPSDYSDYIDISPTVGTIYTGSQLFGTLNALASGSKDSYTESGSTVYQTTAKATANFSGAFSASAKYLCTTANAVKFRAYVSQGTTSDIGTASVVDNSSTKSIFTRIE